jgi:hypothetical protein
MESISANIRLESRINFCKIKFTGNCNDVLNLGQYERVSGLIYVQINIKIISL